MVQDAEAHLRFLGFIDGLAEVLLLAATHIVGIGVLQTNQFVGSVKQTDGGASCDGGLVLDVVALVGRTGIEPEAFAKVQRLVYLQFHVLASPAVFQFLACNLHGSVFFCRRSYLAGVSRCFAKPQ